MSPVKFSRREWAALLPGAAPPPALLADDRPDKDPGPAQEDPRSVELADTERLPLAEVLAVIPEPVTRAAVRFYPLALTLHKAIRIVALYTTLPYSFPAAVVACLFAFIPAGGGVTVENGKTFSRVQLGYAVGATLAVIIGALIMQHIDKFAPVIEASNPRNLGDYSRQPVALLVRFREFVAAEPSSLLLTHVPDDPECACPTCLSRVGTEVGAIYWGESSLKCSLLLAIQFTWNYTAIVTFGPVFWTTWFTAILGLLAIISLSAHGSSFLYGILGQSAPLLKLAKRLQRRAMTLALDELVERLKKSVDPGAQLGAPDAEPPAVETYLELHERIAENWKRRSRTVGYSFTRFAIMFLGCALGGIVSVAGGSCIPAFVPIFLLYLLVNLLAVLVPLAIGNSQIDAFVDLYVSARLALRKACAAAPNGADPRALARADAHDRQLELLMATAERNSARFAGSRVGLGTVRVFVVTVVTIAAALWSVLRSAGVSMVVDNVCPVP